MNNCITLLHPDLLKDSKKIKNITYWTNVLNDTRGWSYDLEIIWILQQLESAGIEKGSTILDAGGGLGVMQYILSSLGYEVISVDYAPRTIPPRVKRIFNIHLECQTDINYKHSYMDSRNYESGLSLRINNRKILFPIIVIYKIIKKAFSIFQKNLYQLMDIPLQYIQYLTNMFYWLLELNKDHSNFGTIKFVRAAFHDLPINSDEIDAVICLASLGHADKELVNTSLAEFKRVLKPCSPLIITTCATNQGQDIFYKKTQGWCFCLKSLEKIVPTVENVDFDYPEVEKSIIESKILKSRLHRYYYLDPESVFYRKKYVDIPYLPVGLTIWN